MIHENFLLIVELTIIIIETIVLLFLIYHFRELRKRTIITHEEIKTMKEAISEMHTFVSEIHERRDRHVIRFETQELDIIHL